MATPVEVIYSKFLNTIDDVELSMIEDDELEELLFDYLENSTIEFFECEKDLTVNPSYNNELVLSCGSEAGTFDFGVKELLPKNNISTINFDEDIDEGFTNNVYFIWEVEVPSREFNEFELYYLEEVIDPGFSVGGEENNNDIIDGIEYERVILEEGVDYKILYDEEESVVYIASLNPYVKSDYLYFIHNSKAYVTDDLDLDEIHILAYGMIMSWVSPKIRREENLRQMMNDRDFKQLSIANMLGKLLDLSKHTRSELTRYKQRYAYKNFKGFN